MRLLIKKILNKFGYDIFKTKSMSFGDSTRADHITLIDPNNIIYDNHQDAYQTIKICAEYSMTTLERLFVLYNLSKYIEDSKIDGDLVECGVWKGGSAGVMADVALKIGKAKRTIWLYDSYEGLPEPTKDDGSTAIKFSNNKSEGKLESIGECYAQEDYVLELMKKINYPNDKIKIIKGWFQDTVPKIKPEKIAILRLDGDWYESTKICITELYDKVVKGGIIVIDDYGDWEGCKKAIDEFFLLKNISPFLHHVDKGCRYFFKHNE